MPQSCDSPTNSEQEFQPETDLLPQVHWTHESIRYLSRRLSLTEAPISLDWPFKIADPERLEEFLNLFYELGEYEDARFTLADVILQSFEIGGTDLKTDHRWKQFLFELSTNLECHKYQILVWSAFEVDLEKAWRVSPYMRRMIMSNM